MCRVVKSNLVRSVQSQSANIRENIMKVCSIKFFLHPTDSQDSFCKDIGAASSFDDFIAKFTEALNNPKYLTHPIKFSTNSDTCDNGVKIVCDNRIVYNTIYYSDIWISDRWLVGANVQNYWMLLFIVHKYMYSVPWVPCFRYWLCAFCYSYVIILIYITFQWFCLLIIYWLRTRDLRPLTPNEFILYIIR